MKKIIKVILIVASFCLANIAIASNDIHLLKMMFNNMVIKKNISLMSEYYDPDFKLYSNGKIMDYQEYYQIHKKVYDTPIQYAIKFDNSSLLQSNNKVAARLFITVKKPEQQTTKIEVIMIAQYRNNKIYRLWELTYPNWANLKEFKSASK